MVGLTALAAVLPGSAFWVLQRRRLGAGVFVAFVVALAALGYALVARGADLARLLVQTRWLTTSAIVLGVCFVAWAGVVIASNVVSRPAHLDSRGRLGATAFTVLVCLVLAAPFVVGIRYAVAQRTFIDEVFEPSSQSFSATRPHVADEQDDPWLGRERVNVLLLGGDAGPNRFGTRTDSIILASIDVSSGDTVLFGLPRNLEDVPFPVGTRLHELYPGGFSGPGDPLQWMVNAIYSRVPELHPAVLGQSDNEGADALKLAVSGALGVPVDYYLLVSIPGFIELIDAMGGVTVNVNQPIPIGGIEGVREPEDYLDPGPDQDLDGFEALWFARGRYGLDDYDRMRRQRCLVDAVIDRADPITLLTRYERILEAGREILRTDIPAEMLPAFVDLAFQVKDARVRSVVFERSNRFAPESPDFAWVRQVVARATGSSGGDGGGGGGAKGGGLGSQIDAASSCAYRPVG
ncbi:MAG: LCP family protein [Nocardioidaceae bacterium]|nr:LCP family protein [Nocardioidaceae bacterium]